VDGPVGGRPVREVVADAVRRLADAGVDSPDHDVRTLLAHVVGVQRSRLPLIESVTDD
jgi:release factor glutamine methyltransferase